MLKVVTSIFFVIKQLAGSPTQQLVDNLFSRFGNLVQVKYFKGCIFFKDFFLGRGILDLREKN